MGFIFIEPKFENQDIQTMWLKEVESKLQEAVVIQNCIEYIAKGENLPIAAVYEKFYKWASQEYKSDQFNLFYRQTLPQLSTKTQILRLGIYLLKRSLNNDS